MADRTRITVCNDIEINNILNLHRCKEELKYAINKKAKEFGMSHLASLRMIDNRQFTTRAFFTLQNLGDNFLFAREINGLEFMGSKIETDFSTMTYVEIPIKEKKNVQVHTAELKKFRETTTSTEHLIDWKESATNTEKMDDEDVFFDIVDDDAKTSMGGM